MDVIVIGVINIHSTLRTALKPGVTNPVSEFQETFFGSALHIAVNASLLKADVGIVSPVGRDAVGLLDLLRRNSVDYSHVVLSSKKNSNFIQLSTPTRSYNLYYEGAVKDLDPQKIEKKYLKKAKIVHICFPDEEVTETLVRMARKEKVLTSVDASFSEADADIVFTEGKRKGNTTIVMDFKEGITCNGKKIPVFRDKMYYDTGVKDAFIAAFLTRYVKSEHPEYSALYGSCAAYLCSRSDKKVLTCTKEDVDNLFSEKVRSFSSAG